MNANLHGIITDIFLVIAIVVLSPILLFASVLKYCK